MSGEPSALGTLIDPGTWEQVQAMRARYSRRHRGSLNRRQYALGGLLACAACGRRLIGHVGRYRHTEACETFKAAAPRRHRRHAKTNLDHRVKGESYKSDLYDAAVGQAFEHVAVSARLKAATVAEATRPEPEGGDGLALARINRERDQAALRFARDRDLGRLETTMARLDAEAEAAVVRPSRTATAAEVRAYLEELPMLWANTSDAGRHAIAEATFERIDVLGVTDYTFTLTAHAKAHGWDAAFGAGDLSISIGQSGRGERIRGFGTWRMRGRRWGRRRRRSSCGSWHRGCPSPTAEPTRRSSRLLDAVVGRPRVRPSLSGTHFATHGSWHPARGRPALPPYAGGCDTRPQPWPPRTAPSHWRTRPARTGGGVMQQFHDEVRIDAPVQQVWAFLCDPAHLHDWATQTEWSDVSGPLDQVGTTFVQTARIMGHEMKGTLEVLEVDPQRLLRLRSDQGVNMVFRFEPQGGGTLLTLEGDYQMPHLPAFLQKLMSKSYIERNTRHQLENIKALVEATVAVPV